MRQYRNVFLLCFITATIMFLPILIINHGILIISDDFSVQQLPFNMFCNHAIKEGNFFWSWETDLGTSFQGAYSFYTLGSPFFWLSFPFPDWMFPYLTAPIFILKYCVAGLTSFCYLKKYVKEIKYAYIGALLYAFSGFQIGNMQFYHFHDVVALFPLLLIGLDQLVEENKKFLFVFAIAVNALINYFFFVGEAVFLVLYFIVKYISYSPKKYIKVVPKCLIYGLLGLGIASFMFIPSILFIMNNPRKEFDLSGINLFIYDAKYYLSFWKGFMMPADIMSFQTSITQTDYSSAEMYIPLFGISLFLIYIKNYKTWLRRFLLVLVLFSLVPVLSSLFYGFSAVYSRWFYMFVLMMVLSSVIVLDRMEKVKYRWAIFATIFLQFVFTVVLLKIPNKNGKELSGILDMRHYLIYLAIGFIGLIVTLILLYIKNKGTKIIGITICCVIVVIELSGISHLLNLQEFGDSQNYAQGIRNDYLLLKDNIKIPEEKNFRVSVYRSNQSMILNVPSTSSFISTASPSIFEFCESLGYQRKVITQFNEKYYGLNPFLSIRYVLTQQALTDKPMCGEYNVGSAKYYLYENTEFIPFGFTYDHYITKQQLMEIEKGKRHLALLKAMVVDDTKVPEISKWLTSLSNDELSNMTKSAYQSDVMQRKNEASYSFDRTERGFVSKIQSNSEKYAFFSVPYDRGWKVTVNGLKREIVDSDGFMSVEIGEGDNIIEFQYDTPGFKIGVIISMVSFLLLIGMYGKLKGNQMKKGL